MQPPMVGTWDVLVHAVRPFEIHGDRYYELNVTRIGENDATDSLLRVPQHALSSTPLAGVRLRLTFLMGQVTAAAPIVE